MSYEENKERKRSNSYFRITMDIGMGLLYMCLGGYIMYFKAFGAFPVPPIIAYVLGAMMLIGGAFRFYKGMRAILPQKS
jgi:hypothetical protein